LLLDRLRKALTTQLHTLRQELGPKEESLMRVTEKLQETDREYELSLQAIAEKEKALGQKSENLNLLQKQVRCLFQDIAPWWHIVVKRLLQQTASWQSLCFCSDRMFCCVCWHR
jgi:septal ring factor EnvC (AmiA/AmiB activator)